MIDLAIFLFVKNIEQRSSELAERPEKQNIFTQNNVTKIDKKFSVLINANRGLSNND
jgi:hypothetical protein